MGKLSSRTARLAVTAGLAATLAVSGLPVAAFAEGATTNKPAAEASTDVATTSVAPTETAEDGADKADASKDNATTEATADAVETPAADSAAPAADAAEAADPKAVGTYEAGGRTFDDFAAAAAEAAKTKGTVTIKKSTGDNLTVAAMSAGITVKADGGVVLSGSLVINADNVTVNGLTFVNNSKGEAGMTVEDSIHANKVKNLKGIGCSFTVPSGDWSTKEAAGQTAQDWPPNAIRIDYCTSVTIAGNSFNLGRINEKEADGSLDVDSICAINLVANGSNVLDSADIAGNTMTVAKAADGVTEKAGVIFLTAMGNGKNGINKVTVSENTFDGAADKDNARFAGFSDCNTVVIEGNTISNASRGVFTTKWHGNSGPIASLTQQNNKLTNVTSTIQRAAVVVGENSYEFASIDEALKSEYAKQGTVRLLQDATEDVVIPAGKTVTLDLAGKKLTNVDGHTITNHGKLTVTDSSNGKTGTVDNVKHAKAAVFNCTDGTVVLDGGSYTRSAENSVSSDDGGNNSYYVLKNFGRMTVKDGSVVKFSDTNTGLCSSLVANGWYNGSDGMAEGNVYGKSVAKLVIEGGTFTGGQITVKNDDYGELTIAGGTIDQVNAGRNAVQNHNRATISGGTITSKDSAAVVSYYHAADSNDGTLDVTGGSITSESASALIQRGGGKATVSGGTFKGGVGQEVVCAYDGASVELSGGAYSSAPDAKYVVEGSGLGKNEDGTFGVREAKLTLGTAAVTYNVKDGELTEAQATQLVKPEMNVEGYSVSLDADQLAAINAGVKAGATGDYKLTFTAVKDGAATAAADASGALTATATFTLTKDAPQPKTWSVTFKYGAEGTADTVVKVTDGDKASKPADPTRDGYEFAGWFSDEALTRAYDFSSTVTGDVTLYAKWNANKSDDTKPGTKPETKTWKVTFVDGIDSTDDPTVEVKDGEAVAKPADPTLDGWKFVGWYTTLNDDGTVENEYDFSQPVKGDLTLYAGWVPVGSSDGTKPEEPKSDNKGNKELPQTGDTTNYAIPVALGVAGVVAVGGALVMRKRQQ